MTSYLKHGGGEYQLVTYPTGRLATLFEVDAEDIKNCFALNVDWQGYPRSFDLGDGYYCGAQTYWKGERIGSTPKFFRRQKWAVFKDLMGIDPIEMGSAFIGEMVAQGTTNYVDRYKVLRVDFTFLRAYRLDLRKPFRKAITISKLKWV